MIHRGLAVDLGAGSGRVLLGTLADGRLTLEEVHRFGNEPVLVHGRFSWDILALYREILKGIRAGIARVSVGPVPATVGIETWGVDFGLLDGRGRLLQNPVCYRDARTDGLIDVSRQRCGEGTLFGITGLPDLFFNTSLQLLAITGQEPDLVSRVERLLFTPDLLNYFLTGVAQAERTIASTSQLLTAGAHGQWSEAAFRLLGIEDWLPKMPPVVEPGTVVGPITAAVASHYGLPPALTVVAVAGHDTESSLLAMPARSEGAVFLTVGSWALLGLESDEPVLDDKFRRAGFSNEAAFGGKVCLLKNIMGLWLTQESKLTWERESGPLDWADLYRQAAGAPAFQAWVDPDDALFVAPGNLPERITLYCGRTGQTPPRSRGAVLRCILESLAFRFRETVESLQSLSGRNLNRIHLMGGGSRGELLCQFTADATGLVVEAGPEEASGTGNLLAQFLATGALLSVDQARTVVRESFGTRIHEPGNTARWTEAYARFLSVTALRKA
jgi:sugar (pentulose or hexulose) kinase